MHSDDILMDIMESYKIYKKSYKNPISVMLGIYRHKNNIKVVLKNEIIKKWRVSEIWEYNVCNSFFENNSNDYFNNKSDYFKFKYNNEDIKFCGIKEGNGDLFPVFINE